MIELADVPGFTGILIHPGNTDDDTAGCLLPNYSGTCTSNGIFGGQSVPAYFDLYTKLIGAVEAGEASIAIVDEDRNWKRGRG